MDTTLEALLVALEAHVRGIERPASAAAALSSPMDPIDKFDAGFEAIGLAIAQGLFDLHEQGHRAHMCVSSSSMSSCCYLT
jgi:hypothetical protein